VFVAVGSISAAVLQLIARRAYRGELRTAIWLPWRLWAGPVVCFVVYGLAWPLALATSTRERVVGVSLINYLWPVLTVVVSVFLVPGVRMTGRTALALTLALAGLALANVREFHGLVFRDRGNGVGGFKDLVPYALALVAAVTWAIYSALLSRWRTWAKDYVTSPIGFLLTGGLACVVLAGQGGFPHGIEAHGMIWTLAYGAGPLAAGYLLWELALAKARVQTLSVIAAGTPVLSTLLLCCFLRRMPGVELALAAILVSVGVVLSARE